MHLLAARFLAGLPFASVPPSGRVMGRMPRIAAWGVAALAALALAPVAHAASANTAALQVALKAVHRYHGSVDGINGPGTKRAVKSFQRRHHLAPDGIV